MWIIWHNFNITPSKKNQETMANFLFWKVFYSNFMHAYASYTGCYKNHKQIITN